MEDHYFGTLPSRVLGYLQDVEKRLWKLGVPVTTRHNEVAPSQYEMAPIFEQVNVATDHNMLMMEVLKETAAEHGLACLLHEKPFAGVNGSGKHNNWSICTNTGENLMDPGKTPEKNTKFMVMLAALVRAISINGDLLRASIAVPGNDHRLGMNEAPPAIMSCYIGDQLLRVVEAIVSQNPDDQQVQLSRSFMSFPVSSLPDIPRDASDRNRTSPFAFAGNKFEFRAVGSSQNCARPVMLLNTIMADSIHIIADLIEQRLKTNKNVEEVTREVVKATLIEHQRAIYNGNGYSQEWRDEAKRRGLPNLATTAEAIKQMGAEKNIQLFEKLDILSRKELLSMQHVAFETFAKHVAIEADCTYSMANSYVLPVALEYKQRLTATLDAKDPAQAELLAEYSKHISALIVALKQLNAVRAKAKQFEEEHLFEQAMFYRHEVMDAMAAVRSASDALEEEIDDKLWPFPKYSELLFLK
jgi:glutamine synthetase